uniref:BTB domain-containing protein n=1 Tax=Ascaris lumbricoides TaxID=6252 RepID=A0A9J2P9Y6_ASCLU
MSTTQPERVGFRYVWVTRVSMRQLSPTEAIILAVSPKFATVYDHVSFQWSLKMHGTACVQGDEEDGDESDSAEGEQERPVSDYVAVSLYFNDGPVPSVDLRAVVAIMGDKNDSQDGEVNTVIEEKKTITMQRGKECELTDTDRAHISDYIKANVGHVIRLSVLIEMSAKLFDPGTYLNSHTPTPITSFLTANYRARASSKMFKKRSRKSRNSSENNGTPSGEGNITNKQKEDLEEAFNRVMDAERERRERKDNMHNDANEEGGQCGDGELDRAHAQRSDVLALDSEEHLFKKLLVACCDSCERRASLSVEERDEDSEDSDDETSFECGEQGKECIHDLLANMYFNKVALPEMDYVEDFADFLIDAELNDLPVLKRACERYLCGELNTKKDLLTSLLLDLLFLAIVFNLPVMKSMTLSELSNRPEDLANPEELLTQEEYKSLDRRMRNMSDRNLVELIEEVQRFREQRLRVHLVKL